MSRVQGLELGVEGLEVGFRDFGFRMKEMGSWMSAEPSESHMGFRVEGLGA